MEIELDIEMGKETVSSLGHYFYNHFINLGITEKWAVYLNLLILLSFIVVIVWIVLNATKVFLQALFRKSSQFERLPFLKYLLKNKLPYYLALIIPYIIVRNSIPWVFIDFPALIRPISKLAEAYLVFIVIWLIMSVVKSFFNILQDKPALKDKPMNSYSQVVQIILYLMGAVIIISIFIDQSPVTILAAMGAASAITLLVFQDSIKGFVASVQVAGNDMVRLNDWITMPKYGADGDVIEVNLTTVKVQNFDKTITTIPTYALISDSFQNWRGMEASGGRRIKRCIVVKQNSIRYILDEELERFKKIQGISDYIEEKNAEIKEYNEKIGADRSLPINGRNLTNSGLFRKYIEWYLLNHPGTNKNMTLMVRQLEPSEKGLPFELYVFTNTTKWVQYEYIMADIFDHLIAAVKYFDLEIFERETGVDVRKTGVLD
ncbi:MAG: mechanosensitive ion channel family protein [Candidatus Azobacteroides sp.]|nr:mechanosensitive ion channel family protein [Candidatus Azobacteroides sp.]